MGKPITRACIGLALIACLCVTPARAERPQLDVYGQLPSIELATISPSGQHMALVNTAGDSQRLLVFDASDKLLTSADLNGMKVRQIEWAGDQSVLVHYSATVSLGGDFTAAKAELGSVLVAPIDGSKAWVVFANNPDVTGGVQDSYGLVERAGRWYGFFSAITLLHSSVALGGEAGGQLHDGRLLPDLYEVDLQTRASRQIAKRPQGDGLRRDWLVDANGQATVTLDIARNTGKWFIDDAHHTVLASGNDPSGTVRLIGFTPDGASVVYAARDTLALRDSWFSVPLAGGTPQPYLVDSSIDSYFLAAGHRLLPRDQGWQKLDDGAGRRGLLAAAII